MTQNNITEENKVEIKAADKNKENKVSRRPDFTGNGVAVWINTDKNGQPYAAVKLFNKVTVSAFPPRAEAAQKEVVQP